MKGRWVSNRYYVLTTYPAQGSGNVGDRLITESAIELMRSHHPDSEFVVRFREEDLEVDLDLVNSSRAVLMPGFAIRDPMWPNLYRLTRQLTDIEVPLVPLGAGCMAWPGDLHDVNRCQLSEATLNFLDRIQDSWVGAFGCRDHLSMAILRNNGLQNLDVVGDCAWYHLPSIGKPMHRPREIGKVVFTVGHHYQYEHQALEVLRLLREHLAGTKMFCAIHGSPAPHAKRIIAAAEEAGFDIVDVTCDTKRIEFYKDCDLHVGYRLHGHIAFLRRRIPSILLCEDLRGLGAAWTLGGAWIPAFARVSPNLSFRMLPRILDSVRHRQPLPTTPIANPELPAILRELLREEQATRWRRYVGVAAVIDDTFENSMEPLLRQIP